MLDAVTFVCQECGHHFTADEQPSRCPACPSHGKSRDFPTAASLTIAAQNDTFRQAMGILPVLICGEMLDATLNQSTKYLFAVAPIEAPGNVTGTVVITRGIGEAGADFLRKALAAVANDQTFTEDNDPWSDHSFGVVTVETRRVWWKIDLYDLAREFGAEAPTDPTETSRVLTIMFPSEY